MLSAALLSLVLMSSFASADGGQDLRAQPVMSRAAAADGGQDPGAQLVQAVQLLSGADAGTAPTARDFHTLGDDARTELALHQQLVNAVPRALPITDGTSSLIAAREYASSVAQQLRTAFGKPSSTLQVQQLQSLLAELVRADQLLNADLRGITEKLQPTAVVVSGGVSLGAYQAGLLHYYSQYLQQHRAEVSKLSRSLAEEPMVATGASAGSVNAFLSAVSTCRKPVHKPEESLFWKVWMPVGFDGLLNVDDVTTYSMLSRAPLDRAVKMVEETWNDSRWSDEPCRLNIGFTVTREIPRTIALNTQSGTNAGQVRLPIQTERVILTLEGRDGKSPSIRSVVGDQPDFFVDWNIDTKQGAPFPPGVSKILQASSAFPVAWPPVMLETNGNPGRGYFLDGGVFDNNPVRLATRLLSWKGPGNKSLHLAHSRILYVEPDATTWHDELAAKAERRESFISMYSQLIASLVGTARKAELLNTLEYDETRTLRDRIDVPLRRWPITGAFLLNFFAFLEEDFRRFDFYSGMADAQEFLSERGGVDRLGLANVEVDSQEFSCVLAFRGQEGTSKANDIPECELLVRQQQTESLVKQRHARNLLALLDTSAAVRVAIFDCIAAKNCRVGTEFETLSSTLPKSGFQFSDPALENDTVIAAVRDRLHPFISAFARKQPFPESAYLSVAGKAGLDAVSVRPSSWYLGLGMHSRSGLELEFSRRLAGAWRPGTVGVRVLRIQSRFLRSLGSDAEEHSSGTVEGYWHPLAVEGGFRWLTAKWPYWLRLGASAGMGAEVTTLEFTPAAYRFPASASVTASILQRFYVRASAKQYVLDACPNAPCGLVDERGRDDAVQLVGNRGDWMVSVGWRWID